MVRAPLPRTVDATTAPPVRPSRRPVPVNPEPSGRNEQRTTTARLSGTARALCTHANRGGRGICARLLACTIVVLRNGRRTRPRHADVAQLVAHHLAKVRVAGSNPVIRSMVQRHQPQRWSGRVVRQRPAKPCTRVRFPSPPPRRTLARLAQRESASLTRKRSLVQSQYRAPRFVQQSGYLALRIRPRATNVQWLSSVTPSEDIARMTPTSGRIPPNTRLLRTHERHVPPNHPDGWRMTLAMRCEVCKQKTVHARLRTTATECFRDVAEQRMAGCPGRGAPAGSAGVDKFGTCCNPKRVTYIESTRTSRHRFLRDGFPGWGS